MANKVYTRKELEDALANTVQAQYNVKSLEVLVADGLTDNVSKLADALIESRKREAIIEALIAESEGRLVNCDEAVQRGSYMKETPYGFITIEPPFPQEEINIAEDVNGEE